MIDQLVRAAFEVRAAKPASAAMVAAETVAAKAGDRSAASALAAAFVHAAFFAPEISTSIYESFSRSWLEGEQVASDDPAKAADAPSAEFWSAFWTLLDDMDLGTLDATKFTERVAGLGKFFAPSMRDRFERAARSHPLAGRPESREPPRRLILGELAASPEGSLGHAIHRLIVDNRFDLEVLDRESIGLAELPPALRFLNTRILQMHDVWHLVGGFRTTGLHEIAISAFQLAQFGHGYSAMLLATVVTRGALSETPGIEILLQTIAEAWAHGHNSPSFMAIDWEDEWDLPIDDIRARHSITPFQGTFPADLFEQIRAQSIAYR
jgi:ubiquinone biosynthesis protein Coq4